MIARARCLAVCLAALAFNAICLSSAFAQPADDDSSQEGGQGAFGQGLFGPGAFGQGGFGQGDQGQNGQRRGGRRGAGGPGAFGQGGFGQGMFPGGFGPGMFGPGMFGGAGRGGRGGGMMGSPNDPFALLKNDAVREELKLTKKQTTQIDKLVEAYQDEARDQMQQARIDPADLQDMSDEDRTKAFQKSRDQQEKTARKLNDKYRPRLSKLLKPDQEKRLKQISWQAVGVMALRGDDLAKALKLSKEQRSEIEDVYEASGKQMRESFRPPEGGFRGRGQGGADRQPADDGEGGGNRRPAFAQGGQGGPGGQGGDAPSDRDFRERFENMRKMGEDRDAKVLAVLTDKQRQQYEQLKGEPFDVSQLRPRWGRGRGGQHGGEDQTGGADNRAGRGDQGSGRGNERAQARGAGRRRTPDDSE